LENQIFEGDNPFAGLEPPGGEEPAKTRALSEEEVGRVWAKLNDPETKIGRRQSLALQLILVTGQRPGEVRLSRPEHFNLLEDKRVWTIPAENIKTSGVTGRQPETLRGKRREAQKAKERTHYVYLNDLALEIVGELIELGKGRPYLFPNDHTHLSWDKPVGPTYLSEALRKLQKGTKLNPTIFGLERFTPHDLRRTVSTRLHALEFSDLWVNKLLNHSDGRATREMRQGRQMQQIYDRHHYWPQKVKMLKRLESLYRDIFAGKYTPAANEDDIDLITPFPYAA
jgi:integrase